MKALLRFSALGLWFAWLPLVWGQLPETKIARIEIKHIGPSTVSDELIRGNLRSKVGEPYRPITVDDDVRNLYTKGLFDDIRVTSKLESDGLVLTFVVQDNPRLTEVKFEGNTKLSNSKIKGKITSKVGEPLDRRKVFTDKQAILEVYQKSGYPRTTVEDKVTVDEGKGSGTVLFIIKESPKIKIERVEFVGAAAFTQKELRKQMKGTTRYGMFSWILPGGYFVEDKFEEDKERLTTFYREHGYIDFEIKDVQMEYPTPGRLVVRLAIYEGRSYKVGQITFEGTTMFPTNAVSPGFQSGKMPKQGPGRATWAENATVNRNFKMKAGDVFTMSGQGRDTEAVQSFYESKGHIDVVRGSANLQVMRVPNTETGTIDIRYKVEEGQKSYIEKIEIRGNTKTKDKVIRRELSVAPGEVFDMTRIRTSKRRLEGLDYFEPGGVETRPEPTDVPNRKNLLVGVREKSTGNISFGAGFSSVDSIVGFAEWTQGNFDLFHPPTFTGGGQKLRLRVQIGTERQDYVLAFTEPWFLNRKLALNTDLYYRNLNYVSLDNLYDETRAGMRVGLTRALGSDFLIGSIGYRIERIGIDLSPGVHGAEWGTVPGVPGGPAGGSGIPVYIPANAPESILEESGYTRQATLSLSLAYDTRNNTRLPDHGQRSEIISELASTYLGGQGDFYKIELQSAWYFPGFAKGHVIEAIGRTGIANGMNGDTVPFYDRFY
ncbi:MAG: BamA/TamA family outer membrane protein, partial [Verrucomicrobia subdivision 3 bacterium]|nr:BamA/TamA family outer membrane protein [Limisphaerales bacterium]